MHWAEACPSRNRPNPHNGPCPTSVAPIVLRSEAIAKARRPTWSKLGDPVLCESFDAGWVGWQAEQVIIEAPCEDSASASGKVPDPCFPTWRKRSDRWDFELLPVLERGRQEGVLDERTSRRIFGASLDPLLEDADFFWLSDLPVFIGGMSSSASL